VATDIGATLDTTNVSTYLLAALHKYITFAEA
jgi:hypothetical protein